MRRQDLFSAVMVMITGLVFVMTTEESYAQGAAGASSSSGHGVDLSNYTLLFQDNFDGTQLDTSVWDYRQENALRQGAVFLRSNITVANGIVRLAGNKTAAGYSCSMLSTENGFHFKYGYAEARVNLSNITFGSTFAFWLQSPKNGSTMDPVADGDEVDVFEYNLNSGGKDFVQHNLHWNGYAAEHHHVGSHEMISGLSSGFHTFGLEWTPKEYVVYVDGVEKTRTTTAVSHHDEFLLLSNLVTDDGFGGDRTKGNFPDSFEIDYVKVYSPKTGNGNDK